MSDLEFHIQRLIAWVHTLKGCPTKWTNVQILEYSSFSSRGKAWKIPKESLMSIKQYEERFNELLMKGYSWININCGGIYQDNAIIFIEYPRQSSDIPKDKVSINLSGPSGHDWNLSKKLCIVA